MISIAISLRVNGSQTSIPIKDRSRRPVKRARALERRWGEPQRIGRVIKKRESPDGRTFRIAELEG
jgi:hypothetical protein